jgi:hypothetical protein
MLSEHRVPVTMHIRYKEKSLWLEMSRKLKIIGSLIDRTRIYVRTHFFCFLFNKTTETNEILLPTVPDEIRRN